MEDIIKVAMATVASLSDDDKVSLKGKAYTMVAQRVQAFRAAAGAHGQILTEVIEQTDQRVIVKASVSVWKDSGDGWNLLATDFAEEYRNQGPVNKTSALENCCTSAIGRALSAAGLSGGEYASSFEVDNAINHKPEAPAKTPAKKKAATAAECPPVAKATQELVLKKDDLNLVAEVMRAAMKIETTVEGLRSFYSNNGVNMKRMENEEPDMHKELVAEMRALSKELSNKNTTE